MTAKAVLSAVLAVTMVFGATGTVLAAERPETTAKTPIISQTAPSLLTNAQLEQLIETAPDLSETRSAMTIADRRITESELTAWITEYWELGINSFELEVVRLINIERENYGLHPLAISPTLMMTARFHSHQMADLVFFGHRSEHHGRGTYRAAMFGYENIQEHVFGVHENIAGSTRSPERVVQLWMNSPGHRAALFERAFLTIGIGAVQGGSTTANFGG